MKLKQLKKYDSTGQFKGLDKFGNKKVLYLKMLTGLTVSQLSMESKKVIKRWLFLKTNHWHWKMNACYFECLRRKKQGMFHRQYRYTKYEKVDI